MEGITGSVRFEEFAESRLRYYIRKCAERGGFRTQDVPLSSTQTKKFLTGALTDLGKQSQIRLKSKVF